MSHDPDPRDEAPLTESEAIARRMSELCAQDDAPGALRFLKRQKARSWEELAHSKKPIEYAIAHDAERVFEALLDLSEAEPGGREGLRLRLWGGLGPVHQCAYVERDNHPSERGAPKCLKAALRREPLLAFWRDEDGRSALDWAAMSEDATAFAILLNSLRRAQASGARFPEPLAPLLSKAAILAVSYAYDPPFRLAQIEAMRSLGFDWREAATDQGQSALARCLNPLDSPHARNADAMAALLIQAGANLSAPNIIERSPFDPPPAAPAGSCLQALFSPSESRWSSRPKAFAAAAAQLEGPRLLDLLEREPESGAPSLASVLLRHPSHPAAQIALARREAELIKRAALGPATLKTPTAPKAL